MPQAKEYLVNSISTSKKIEGSLQAKKELKGNLDKTKSLVGGIQYGTPTVNYARVINKPKINTVELSAGDNSFGKLGVFKLTNSEIEDLLK